VNSRLDEIQAAMLRVKLKYLEAEITARRRVAHRYLDGIRNPHIQLPQVVSDDAHVWHLFVIRSARRDALQKHLQEKAITTLIHYPVPPHKQPAYASMNSLSLPITEAIHQEVLSLPIGPTMSDDDIQIVIDACNTF